MVIVILVVTIQVAVALLTTIQDIMNREQMLCVQIREVLVSHLAVMTIAQDVIDTAIVVTIVATTMTVVATIKILGCSNCYSPFFIFFL